MNQAHRDLEALNLNNKITITIIGNQIKINSPLNPINTITTLFNAILAVNSKMVEQQTIEKIQVASPLVTPNGLPFMSTIPNAKG